MNIPISIAENGGDLLRRYIENARRYEEAEKSLHEAEEKVKRLALNIERLMWDYMPLRKESNIYYNNGYDKLDEVIKHIHFGENVMNEILATEECLKELKEWVLKMFYYKTEMREAIEIRKNIIEKSQKIY